MQKGKQSLSFETPPRILSYSSIVGKKEGEGPLGKYFGKKYQFLETFNA
jgi:stage V sporulation protein AD